MGRASAAAFGGRTVRSAIPCHHEATLEKRAEGTTNTGGAHAETPGELGRSGGPLVEQAARDALSGLSGEFHNSIVA